MDIQKRKLEIEESLGKVRQDMTKLEQMLRDAAATEQRMLGALTVLNEILAMPETTQEQG